MNEVLLMIVITSIGIECRSVSIHLHHREKYEVKDVPERTFIDLPDDAVKLLDVDVTSPYDQLEIQLDKLNENDKSGKQTQELPVTIKSPSDGENDNQPVNKTSNAYDPDVTSESEKFNFQEYEEYFNQKGFDDDDDDNEDNDNGYDDSNDDVTDTSVELGGLTPRRLHKDGHVTDIDDVENDDNAVDRTSREKRHFRFRRDTGYQQWRHSLPGQHTKRKHQEDIVWEEVTDEDLTRAKYGEFLRTAKYVGMTLLSVTCFVFIGYCFIRDPVAFVFAFGTGCPCCIICCPCIRKFTDKYLNVKKIIKDSMNRYMPGMIIKDDGTFETYEPSGEELAIMEEILDEIMDDTP